MNHQKTQTNPMAPRDPVGLFLDPLRPCRPSPSPLGTLKAYHLTPWYLRHYTYIQAYMPYESSEDPVGLPLDPLGSWIGIKDQLADLSRPTRPCLFYTLDECIWPMKKQLSTLPNFPRKIPHATYCQKSWKGWRTLKYWSYKKSMWDVFLWRTSNFYVKSSAGISWIGIRTRWSVTFGRSSAVMFETTFTKHHLLFHVCKARQK